MNMEILMSPVVQPGMSKLNIAKMILYDTTFKIYFFNHLFLKISDSYYLLPLYFHSS